MLLSVGIRKPSKIWPTFGVNLRILWSLFTRSPRLKLPLLKNVKHAMAWVGRKLSLEKEILFVFSLPFSSSSSSSGVVKTQLGV